VRTARRSVRRRAWVVLLAFAVALLGLPGAAVASDTAPVTGYRLDVVRGPVGAWRSVALAVTGPDGTTTTHPASGAVVASAPGAYSVHAGNDVFADLDVAFTVVEGETAVVTLVLHATQGEVLGFVTSAAGLPTGNAVAVSLVGDDGASTQTVRTDADGSYHFYEVQPGRYEVHEGSDTAVVDVVADQVALVPSFVAPARADVVGRVVAPADIDETRLAVAAFATTGGVPTFAASATVAGGAFHLSVPAAGQYVIEVSAPWDETLLVPTRRLVTLGEGPNDVGVVTLGDGAPITGLARDARGRPSDALIRAREVSCATGAPAGPYGQQAPDVSPSSGRFRFPGVPGSCYDIDQALDSQAGSIAPRRVPAGSSGVVVHPRYLLELDAPQVVSQYGATKVRVALRTPVPSSVATPAGVVTLTEHGEVVATARPVGGYATFALGTRLAVGIHQLTARVPAGEFVAATTGVQVAVKKAHAVMSVSAKNVRLGARATVTVKLRAGVPVTGRITLGYDELVVGRGTLHKVGSAYVAVIRTAPLRIHRRAISVTYHGSRTVMADEVQTRYRT